MKVLFEVGEEVIVVSDVSPEVNGEYVVESLLSDGSKPYKMTSKGANVTSKEPQYALANLPLYAVKQSSLRKKHKPSDYDFNELMSEIKDLVTV